MLKNIVTVIDNISRWTGTVVSYIMFLVVAIVCFEVTMRYLFHRPTIWASEAMVFCCGLVYVLGASWTLLDNRHVKIDMFRERISSRGKRLIDLVTFFFFALYMVMMIWEGSKFAWESLKLLESTGTPWDPPVYPLKIAFVAGLIMLSLQGVSKAVKDLHFVVKGKEL